MMTIFYNIIMIKFFLKILWLYSFMFISPCFIASNPTRIYIWSFFKKPIFEFLNVNIMTSKI